MKTSHVIFVTLFFGSYLYSQNQYQDIDGNIYTTVEINKKNWTTSNLNVSHYKNGDVIRQAKTDED